MMETLQYPIGKFEYNGDITKDVINSWIEEIETLPSRLRKVVAPLVDEQLNSKYRPGGWTIRQVVHHIGDSHMNSLIRFKWALTEDRPTIKVYYEDRWAELIDYKTVPIEDALQFIELLHKKWVIVLRSLTDEDLKKEYIHPESGVNILDRVIGMYAWHGNHHLAHITTLCEKMGW